MEQTHHSSVSFDVVSHVRRNAGSAGLAAALMLFFGFSHLARPVGNDLFAVSAMLFYHTLRIGGIVMAVIAAWSLLGRPLVLVVDAVASVAIGICFALSGVGLLAGGGEALQSILNVVFGCMFIGAGVRNWREYRLFSLTVDRVTSVPGTGRDTVPKRRATEAPSSPPGPSLARQLRQRLADPGDNSSTPRSSVPVSAADTPARIPDAPLSPDASDPSTLSPPAQEVPASNEQRDKDAQPTPDGFLASFGDEGPPRST